MNIVWLKILLLLVMVIVTCIAGMLPLLKLLRKSAASASSLAKRRGFSLMLCLLTCFSGGVFFATCFLHLFPELNEHLNHVIDYHMDVSYPLAELLSCCGFFLLFFLEEIFLLALPGLAHSHSSSLNTRVVQENEKNGGDNHGIEHCCHETAFGSDENEDSATHLDFIQGSKAEPEACETNCETVKEDPPILMKSQPHAHSHGIRSITFVLAISFHSIIEGLAFGVQVGVWIGALFISLMVHKVIVAFSVGLQLARTHAHALSWVGVSILLFAAMSPLGAVIGMFVQNAHIDSELRDYIILVFQGLAVGTFIYVTFFEVLLHERDNEHPNLLKLVFMLVGFALIGLLRLFDEHEHNHIHEHSNEHFFNIFICLLLFI
uniref:Zinc transporter ZIP3 n=1 Tax=Syphacia muris TaxID=451379 RepID=A0A0N5AX90_9BILA